MAREKGIRIVYARHFQAWAVETQTKCRQGSHRDGNAKALCGDTEEARIEHIPRKGSMGAWSAGQGSRHNRRRTVTW